MPVLFICLLLVLLFGAASFGAYELSEARRWRQTAAEARDEAEEQTLALDEAKRAALQSEAESSKNRELAEMQFKLLTHMQEQLEEKFRAFAAEALQANSQLFLDRSSRPDAARSRAGKPVAAAIRRAGAGN